MLRVQPIAALCRAVAGVGRWPSAARLAAGLSTHAQDGPTQRPVQFTPREMTPEHVRKIGEADAAMRERYDALPDPARINTFARAPTGPDLTKVEVLRKRLLYRSKQRGW